MLNNKLKNKINEYLYFGYLIKEVDFELLKLSTNEECSQINDHSDIQLSKLLEQLIENVFPDKDSFERCIIPLSGGWDSRLLLGAVLEKYPRNKVIAATYGCAGQLDYELGKLLANELGIKHVAINLDKEKITWDKLLESVLRAPWTYTPDCYYNQLLLNAVSASGNDIVISGFMGDPLTGGHIGTSTTADVARARFIEKQRKLKTICLNDSDYRPQVPLCELTSEESNFDFDERYDIAIRQVNCIAPIVTFNQEFKSWTSKVKIAEEWPTLIMPFADEHWAHFWSSNPKKNKKQQKQYLKLLSTRYPELYKLPSKANYGASIHNGRKISYYKRKYISKVSILLNRLLPKYFSKNKGPINYIDYDIAFRYRNDYKEVLDFSMSYLERKMVVPWLNLAKMQEEHSSKVCDHGDAFTLLVGLAANLYLEEN